MKSKIRLSAFSLTLTILLIGILLISCILSFNEKIVFYSLLPILLILIIAGLFYAPRSIIADENAITIAGYLKNRTIPMYAVESVELFQPTMGAIRLWASGGFMGYWGLFREGDIGKYMAYYGKASDCFLVRLTNGDKYVLGCETPAVMVAHINSLLKKTAE